MNATCGFWQYFTSLWDFKLSSKDASKHFKSNNLADRVNECLNEVNNRSVRAIASAYNNDEIVKYIEGDMILT